MSSLGLLGPVRSLKLFRRCLSNIHVPFHEDLTVANDEDFGLGDFQHYQESPDVKAKMQLLMRQAYEDKELDQKPLTFPQICQVKEPLVVISKLSDPYINLAIEDYIYNAMPIPKDNLVNYNRLLFYTNNPCVVIGKNQNPWKEANLPLLNSLKIPLIRRRSGGGTVVHDKGNVNFSFMTTKDKFDRFKFTSLLKDAINNSGKAKYSLAVNERGDITTVKQDDGICYKVSGSAYKLSKGKSYHHGTMLLNSRLDILGKLLSRDESKLGKVDAKASIDSVRSKVVNIEMDQEDFINSVTGIFEQNFVKSQENKKQENKVESHEEYDQNELFGLTDFVEANNNAQLLVIEQTTELPHEVTETANELQQWKWRFGATPVFSHTLSNLEYAFDVTFSVGKQGYLEDFELNFASKPNQDIIDSFQFLRDFIGKNQLEYTGSNIAGFITDDKISDWVGESIDGTS